LNRMISKLNRTIRELRREVRDSKKEVISEEECKPAEFVNEHKDRLRTVLRSEVHYGYLTSGNWRRWPSRIWVTIPYRNKGEADRSFLRKAEREGRVVLTRKKDMAAKTIRRQSSS